MGGPTHKRKQFWVDPPLQLQMLAVVVALVLSSLALVSFSVIYGLKEAASTSRQIFHTIDWVGDAMRAPLLLSATISLLSSAVVTLIWSHRLAGPLRVLAAAVQRIKQGNLSVPVRIRRLDTHQDLVRDFAAMQDRLRELVEKDRKAALLLADRLDEARKGQEGAVSKTLEDASAKLRAFGSHYQL